MEAARLVPLQRRPDAVGLRRNHQWKPTTAAAAAADQPISSQGPGARRFEPVGVAAAQLDQLFQRRRDGRSPAPGPEFRVGRTVKKKQQLDARRTKKRQEKKTKQIDSGRAGSVCWSATLDFYTRVEEVLFFSKHQTNCGTIRIERTAIETSLNELN